MIVSISSDHASFKAVKFTPGFNVILADRTVDSTKQDTRNGLGKSTLIEVIHFCLGGGTSNGKGLLTEELVGWTFFLELELAGKRFEIGRNTTTPKRITVVGDTSTWPLQPIGDGSGGQRALSVADWNAVLGELMFGIQLDCRTRDFTPSFRSLISYFIRRGPDAYNDPFEHFRKQQEWVKQVDNSYLLDLNWEYASEWQRLKDRKKVVDDLQKAAKAGLLDELVGSIGDLEAQKVLLERRARQEETDLKNFKVHERYREIENRANTLTKSIHDLANVNFSERQLLTYYESSLADEREPSVSEVIKIYDEAKISLGESVKKRLEDVEIFHRTLIRNRRVFLASEIARLTENIADRDQTIKLHTEERAGLLTILDTHRALDEHTQLERLHLQTIQEASDISNRIERLRQFEDGRSKLRIDLEVLQQAARRDYLDRRPLWEPAVDAFNALSESLYKAPGKLVIDVGPHGFKFSVEIQRSSSEGIASMKVFCYDLMLATLWAKRPRSPRLLVHDSTIFDPVDSRQRAVALELAQREADESGFQYICTLNSDMVPFDEFSPGWDFDRFVRLRLTDTGEDGGLLGIRF